VSEENKTTEQSTNDVQNQDSQQPVFQIPTEAADLIGDGKKYNSAEEALKSVPHAQKHIQTLESELATLKDELSKRRTTEELLDEIKSGIQPQATPAGTEFDQDKLMQLVNQTLESKERQKAAVTNAESVASKFTEKYGSKAEEVYNSIARESGLTVSQLNNLAASSPKIVLKLAGLEGSSAPVAGKPSSSVNTEALGHKPDPNQLSARVKQGATTKDLVNAWKIAGQKVKLNLSQ
jgi:LysM repeat protein